MSILSFNLSVSNKDNMSDNNEPFQIMPSTRTVLSDKSINSYPKCNNENILIHMNYITKVFKNEAIENNSFERISLRQHVKLARKLGTKNILIHMPSNENELNNLGVGFKVMYDELISNGMIVHLEIASWSKQLISKLTKDTQPKEYVTNFITKILSFMNTFAYNDFHIVIDTAHLHANGCDEDDMEYIIMKFKDKIKYIHFNGNINNKFTCDSHTAMFANNNKIKNWQKLSEFCAKLNKICIAEITKTGSEWNEWVNYANEYGFKLVEYNNKYSF